MVTIGGIYSSLEEAFEFYVSKIRPGALTNSVGLCTFVDSVMHDEYLHGQESISGGSLESELAKSPSPVPVDFPIKQHISSNQKKGTRSISHVFVNFVALLLLEISEALYL